MPSLSHCLVFEITKLVFFFFSSTEITLMYHPWPLQQPFQKKIKILTEHPKHINYSRSRPQEEKQTVTSFFLKKTAFSSTIAIEIYNG